MASAASDGEPMPASTTTGTPACSTMIRICSSVCRPWADPIGDPSGITVTVPISSSFLARRAAARRVRKDSVSLPVDDIQDGFGLGVVEVETAQRDRDQLAPGCLERGEHRFVVSVLAGAEEEARAELDAGDDQAVGGRGLHEFSLDGGRFGL